MKLLFDYNLYLKQLDNIKKKVSSFLEKLSKAQNKLVWLMYSYEELVLNAALFGEDITETDFLCYDLYICFQLNGSYELPHRLKNPSMLQDVLKNVNVDCIVLALFIDIGTNDWSFKRAVDVFNAIDNSSPLAFIKLIKDRLDEVFAISRKLHTDMFLNWFKHRTEVKAKYSKSIADFYVDFCKKYDEFNRNTMFLH